MIGKTVSHYRIIEELGQGGMGVVYKAEDTKLKRTVALKFLPPELTRDPQAKERFIHEAQAASKLQHHNICTIHEVDETDEGQLFICMDYYEGETLKSKIEKRPLKLKDAIDIATQIAQGLGKAHETGIIHRDMKPANVIITETGEAKILDFGLAKLTGKTKLTMAGHTLGTAAYMSPEQMRGDKVDHRTDIWSLGVILYEMIAGQLPFKGDYEQAISYAILNEEPEPLTALRTGVPIPLESIVFKMLSKDPKNRYQHVDEVPVDLKAIDVSSTSQVSRRSISDVTKQKIAVKQKRIDWKITIPIITATAILVFLSTWLLKPRPEKQVVRFPHMLPQGETLDILRLAISPDGKKIVYGESDFTELYLKRIDQLEATPIENTEGAQHLFFSPNSRELGFWAKGELRKMHIDGGGIAHTVCELASAPRGGTWGDDGTIVFVPRDGSGLSRVSALGGVPETIFEPDSGYYRWPEFLPGSKAVLYTAWEGSGLGNYDEANIVVFSLETGKSEILVRGGTHPIYSVTGHILFGRSGCCWAVPFDVKGIKITGDEFLVQEAVFITVGGSAHFRVSTNGTLVYIPGAGTGERRSLVLVDRDGSETPFIDIQRSYLSPRFSPDGTELAIEILEVANPNILIHDIARGIQTQLTSEDIQVMNPNWHPDGQKLTYCSNRSGFIQIYEIRTDGTGEEKLLWPSENSQWGGSWSNDGSLFAFQEDHPTTNNDVWIYTTKDSTATVIVNTPNNESDPAISPNGKCVAYISNKSGVNEVYITQFPGSAQETRVSTNGGEQAVWSLDGRELFYREGNKMMVVPIETQPSVNPGIPRKLFEKPYLFVREGAQYDIYPVDGRFLMIKGDESGLDRLNIILNWFEVLKKKMAGAG